MTFLRLLIFFLILWLLFWLIKRLWVTRAQEDAPPTKPAAADMVRCERCGVHLPRTEALTHDSRYYCCARHQAEDTDRS